MPGTPLSLLAIQALFQTGDIPTQTDFENAWSSFPNIVDENLLTGSDDAVVGVNPPDQLTATPLTKRTNVCIGGSPVSRGYLLPPAVPGRSISINNNTSAANYYYPQVGESINGLGTDSPLITQPNITTILICLAVGSWAAFTNSNQYTFTKLYNAVVNQSGTSAPATVTEVNQLGNTAVWSRDSTGIYRLHAVGVLPAFYTVVLINLLEGSTATRVTFGYDGGNDDVLVYCRNASGTLVDTNEFAIYIIVNA
jgi:hypothetical protein